MSLFDRLLGWVRDKAAAWAESRANARAARVKGLGERIMAGSLMGGATGYGWGTGGGVLYQDRFEQVQHFKHWSYVAINCRANLIAGLKPNIAYVREKPEQGPKAHHKSLLAQHRYQKSLHTIQDHEEIEPVADDHPLRRLLQNPNDWDVASDLWYETEMYLDLTGEAYIWEVPSEGKQRGIEGFGPAELFVIPSQWVWPQLNQQGIDYYEIRPFVGPGNLRLPPNEVVAFKSKSPLHKLAGHSPQTAGAEWIDAAESVDRSRFWSNKNGCFPSGVLEMDKESFPHDPDEGDLNRLLAKFYSRLQGEEKFGLPVALPPGLTYKPLSVSPTEMAYFQTAEQLRDFVLALFGVPKECVGIQPGGSELSWYAPLEQMCRFTISPRLRYFGEVLTKELASEWNNPREANGSRRGKLRIWWDDPTPDNPTVVNAALALDAANGWITPNEARAIRGREAYPHGGDDPMLPATLAPMPWVSGEEQGGSMDLDAMFGQAGVSQPRSAQPDGENPEGKPEEEPATPPTPAPEDDEGQEQPGPDELSEQEVRRLGKAFIDEILAEKTAKPHRKCGGEGGTPGPCAEAGAEAAGKAQDAPFPHIAAEADTKAKTLLQRIREVPGKALEMASKKVSAAYTKMETKYGKKWAIAIVAAGIAGVPVPGGTLAPLAVMAAAKMYKQLTGGGSAPPPEGKRFKEANWDEGKHPRDDSGKFGSGSGSGNSGSGKSPAPSLADLVGHVEEAQREPSVDAVKKLADALSTATHATLDKLKKKLGVRAGGPKSAKAQKLAKLATQRLTVREHWVREARKAGVRTRDLIQAAGRARVLHRETAGQINSALNRTRQLYQHYTGKRLTRGHPAFRGGDVTQLQDWDKISQTVADSFPGLFGGQDQQEVAERLMDLVAAGPQQPLKYSDSYSEALNYLLEGGQVGNTEETGYLWADEPDDLFVHRGRVFSKAFEAPEMLNALIEAMLAAETSEEIAMLIELADEGDVEPDEDTTPSNPEAQKRVSDWAMGLVRSRLAIGESDKDKQSGRSGKTEPAITKADLDKALADLMRKLQPPQVIQPVVNVTLANRPMKKEPVRNEKGEITSVVESYADEPTMAADAELKADPGANRCASLNGNGLTGLKSPPAK